MTPEVMKLELKSFLDIIYLAMCEEIDLGDMVFHSGCTMTEHIHTQLNIAHECFHQIVGDGSSVIH